MESDYGSESNWGPSSYQSTPSYSRSSSYESSYDSSESSYGSSYSSESRGTKIKPKSKAKNSKFYSTILSNVKGLTYEDWIRTRPAIMIGGLSSASEMHEAYEEWLRERLGKLGVRMPDTIADNLKGEYEKWVGDLMSRLPENPNFNEFIDERRKYNSLDDIDKLIERLETSMKDIDLDSERVNKALEERKAKISKLKELANEARRKEKEDRILSQIEAENNDLDEAIESISQGLKR